MTKEKFDCEYTNEIVCIYCGYKDTDSWETEESGLTNCHSCGKEFYVEVNVSVSYSSSCGATDEDCDFVDEPTEAHPDYQKCSRCLEVNFKSLK